MDKFKFTEAEKIASFKEHQAEMLERNQSILLAIKELNLKEKSREYLEREVAELRLELNNAHAELKILNTDRRSSLIDKLYLFKGVVRDSLKPAVTYGKSLIGRSGGDTKSLNSSASNAVRHAQALWKDALSKNEVKWGDKSDFILKIQAEYPDTIGKLEYDHLNKNVLKFPS